MKAGPRARRAAARPRRVPRDAALRRPARSCSATRPRSPTSAAYHPVWFLRNIPPMAKTPRGVRAHRRVGRARARRSDTAVARSAAPTRRCASRARRSPPTRARRRTRASRRASRRACACAWCPTTTASSPVEGELVARRRARDRGAPRGARGRRGGRPLPARRLPDRKGLNRPSPPRIPHFGRCVRVRECAYDPPARRPGCVHACEQASSAQRDLRRCGDTAPRRTRGRNHGSQEEGRRGQEGDGGDLIISKSRTKAATKKCNVGRRVLRRARPGRAQDDRGRRGARDGQQAQDAEGRRPLGLARSRVSANGPAGADVGGPALAFYGLARRRHARARGRRARRVVDRASGAPARPRRRRARAGSSSVLRRAVEARMAGRRDLETQPAAGGDACSRRRRTSTSTRRGSRRRRGRPARCARCPRTIAALATRRRRPRPAARRNRSPARRSRRGAPRARGPPSTSGAASGSLA